MGDSLQDNELSVQELRALVPQLREVSAKYQHAEQLQKTLFDISELSGSVIELNALFPALHRILKSVMHVPNFFVVFYNRDDATIDFAYYDDERDELPSEVLPVSQWGKSYTGHVLKTGEALFLRHETFDEQLQKIGSVGVGSRPVDWIGVPLKRGETVIGAIVVQSYDESLRYVNADLEVLTFMCQHIVTCLDRVKSRELTEQTIRERTRQLRQINQELQDEIQERQRVESLQQALFEISELAASQDDDGQRFYRDLHGVLARLLNAPNCYVAIYNSQRDGLLFPYYSDEIFKTAEPRNLSKGLTEYVLDTGQAQLLNKKSVRALVEQGKLDEQCLISMQRTNSSWMGVPLIVDGEVQGALAIQNYAPDFSYSHSELELMRYVSQHIAVVIERKRAAETIQAYNQQLANKVAERTRELDQINRHLKKQIDERKEIELKLIHDAHHDTLTGLPNRLMFHQRLVLAIESKQRYPERCYAILFIDLDRFKLINDTLGHQAGDGFLIEVAQRIKQCIRGNDLLARMGGDEFVILLDNFEQTTDAEDVAKRVNHSLAQPFLLLGREMYSGGSIGVAFIENGEQSAEELVRDADAAMYEAKATGRGRYVLFDQSMRDKLLNILDLENAFRSSLRKDSFTFYTQPCVKLGSGDVLYYECFIRWQHEKLGEISQEQFWQVAEQCGMTIDIDDNMLSHACALLENWPAYMGEAHKAKVAVNLSINHLLQPGLLEKLAKRIAQANISARQLVFEFDERALHHQPDLVLSVMRSLKNAGVTLVLDNFGSGVASLGYLFDYPFDYVKIDRRFTQSLPDSQRNTRLIHSALMIASNQPFELIVDGMENQRQLDFLRAAGCKFAQGTLLQKAQPIELVE